VSDSEQDLNPKKLWTDFHEIWFAFLQKNITIDYIGIFLKNWKMGSASLSDFADMYMAENY